MSRNKTHYKRKKRATQLERWEETATRRWCLGGGGGGGGGVVG